MSIRIVRLGSPRAINEIYLGIGTPAAAPVKKEEFASRDFYDVWLPNLAPSEELLKQALAADDIKAGQGVPGVNSCRNEGVGSQQGAGSAGNAIAPNQSGARLLLWRMRHIATARSCASCYWKRRAIGANQEWLSAARCLREPGLFARTAGLDFLIAPSALPALRRRARPVMQRGAAVRFSSPRRHAPDNRALSAANSA